MTKLYKKVENWLWIILLIGALVYFHWLVENFHFENVKLQQAQKQFDQEIEEKYQRNKQFQVEIQAQINETTQKLLKFLQIEETSDSCETKK